MGMHFQYIPCLDIVLFLNYNREEILMLDSDEKYCINSTQWIHLRERGGRRNAVIDPPITY